MIQRCDFSSLKVDNAHIPHLQNTFRVLYRTFTQCFFIEDEGDIVFYKNSDGKAQRMLAEGALDIEFKKPSYKLD